MVDIAFLGAQTGFGVIVLLYREREPQFFRDLALAHLQLCTGGDE